MSSKSIRRVGVCVCVLLGAGVCSRDRGVVGDVAKRATSERVTSERAASEPHDISPTGMEL